MSEAFTLLADEATHEIPARVEAGRVRLAPETVREVLGWTLRPEGLCRGSVCVPVRDREALAPGGAIDLEALAGTLDRPLALDPEARAAALGASADERAAALEGGQAPDFTLPDLEGRPHTLSAHRGKKVLLIAYASW
jgi:hypothetical protein